MPLDYNSLLLAIGIAGACLSTTLFATWLSSRSERFLLTWSVGACLIVANVFVYSLYVIDPRQQHLAVVAFSLLVLGFAVIYGGAVQFRVGGLKPAQIGWVAGPSLVVVLAGFLVGLNGLGFIFANLASAALLAATAHQYWLARAEAPGPILGVVLFHLAAAASFMLCAAVLISDGALVLQEAPQNWAETVNVITGIVAFAGIGALSLALNQSRLARRHRREAETDALTGLVSRRALFERYRARSLPEGAAVVVFDLDDFKGVNDRYGHSFGDKALRCFASAMLRSVRDSDVPARLGGEEFALVLSPAPSRSAIDVAERIRMVFGMEDLASAHGPVNCTVSAGVAICGKGGQAFEDVLVAADQALYQAKRAGRNRVVVEGLKLVAG